MGPGPATKGRRAIHDFLDFEEEMHRRLNFTHYQLERMERQGPWRPQITIDTGEFEPIGHKTQVIHLVKTVDRKWWWWVGGGAVLFVLLLILLLKVC